MSELQRKCPVCDKSIKRGVSVQCAGVSDKQLTALNESSLVIFRYIQCAARPAEITMYLQMIPISYAQMDRILSCMDADRLSFNTKIDNIAAEINRDVSSMVIEMRNNIDLCKDDIRCLELSSDKRFSKLEVGKIRIYIRKTVWMSLLMILRIGQSC